MLVCNLACDTGLTDKYTPCYSGPYIVHQQTKGGAYVLTELDGTFLHQGFAAFRLLPYKPRLPHDLHMDPDPTSVGDQGSETESNGSISADSESTDEWYP